MLRMAPEAKVMRKICIHEMCATEEGTFSPSGRRMYIDSDAPLDSIPGWKTAQKMGEFGIGSQMFDSIKDIVEESYRKMEKD